MLFRNSFFRTSLLTISLLFGLQNIASAFKVDREQCKLFFHDWTVKSEDFTHDFFKYQAVVSYKDPRVENRPLFNVVRWIIKPLNDYVYLFGATVVDGKTALERINTFGDKNRRLVSSMMDDKGVVEFFDELHGMGNMKPDEMVAAIIKFAKANPKKYKNVKPYKFMNVVGFVSGFGSAFEFAAPEAGEFLGENFGYNILYGTGEGPKDPQSGRGGTFIDEKGPKATKAPAEEGLTGFDDPSDEVALGGSGDLKPAEALDALDANTYMMLQSKIPNWSKYSRATKNVIKTKGTVFIAEEDRDWMDEDVWTQPWGKALISASELIEMFNTGLDEVWVMVDDPYLGIEMTFTNKVYDQWQEVNGELVVRDAESSDYTQRGGSQDKTTKKRTTRSGPNMTRKAREKLDELITEWMSKKYPKYVQNYAKAMGSKGVRLETEWVDFIVNPDLPEFLPDHQVEWLAQARRDYHAAVNKHANEIKQWIIDSGEVNVGLPKLKKPYPGERPRVKTGGKSTRTDSAGSKGWKTQGRGSGKPSVKGKWK